MLARLRVPALAPGRKAALVVKTSETGTASWRGVLVYLGIAYGLSWVAQITLALAQLGGVGAEALTAGGSFLIAAVFLMWPPAIGAFVARRWVEGGNFADAGLRRPPWRYVAIAWFLPALLTLAAMLLSLPLYPFDPSFSTLTAMAEQAGQPLPAPPAVIVAAQLVLGLTLAVPLNSIFAFGEEFGWRGYLLPRLMSLLGPWRGIVAHGAVWGFWHAPLILLIGYNYPGHPVLGVPLFIVFGTLFGIIMAWLQLASRSVFVPTIAHGALNAVAGAPLLLLHGVDPAFGGVLYSMVGFVVLAAFIAFLYRRGALPR